MTSAMRTQYEKLVASLRGTSEEYGPVASFFTFFQGRATFFASLFALAFLVEIGFGIWGFVHGKDVGAFATFLGASAAGFTAIAGVVVIHSCKEDWANLTQQKVLKESDCSPAEQTNVTVNKS